MHIGAALSLPWLASLGETREAVIAFDRAGLHHVGIAGHLLTAQAERYPDKPVFTYASVFRDPFVLFASLAPATSRIRFRTSILILPMMPTAVVAKQAADLSILSGARLDLGVGVSWQRAEYAALGRSLSGRARRMEEQIEVLRRLWTEPRVSFHGEFHDIDDLGLGELPAAPIPIWIGCGNGEAPLRRVARLADGWLPIPEAALEPASRLRQYAEEAKRGSEAIAISGRAVVAEDLVQVAQRQRDAGATQLMLSAPLDADVTAGVEAIIRGAKQLQEAGLAESDS